MSGKNRSYFISDAAENKLWDGGILGRKNPKTLQNTVIYLIGILFCLRGGTKMRRLRFNVNPQITFQKDQNQKDCLRYHEDVSKCNSGGLKSFGLKGKTVLSYQNENDHNRCLPCSFRYFLSRRQSSVTSDFPNTPGLDCLYIVFGLG